MQKPAFMALFVVLLVGLLFAQAGSNPAESHPSKTASTAPRVAGLPPQRSRRWLLSIRRRFAPR